MKLDGELVIGIIAIIFLIFFFCTIVGITIRPMRCSPAGSLCIGYIHKQLELRSNMEHVVRRVYLYVSER